MRHPHRYEEMFPEEFEAELARAPIAYWSCGAMEEHGLHNVLGTDYLLGYETCLRAVRLSGGVLFPPVPFAPAGIPSLSRDDLRGGMHSLYPPSLWTSVETCRALYTELLEALADLGFRACIAFGGHYPADVLLQEIDDERGGRIGSMRFWGGGLVSILRDVLDSENEKRPLCTDHGMLWETSLLLAVREDYADLARAARLKASGFLSQLSGQPDEATAAISEATVAYGNRMHDLAAERLAALAARLLE